MTVQLDVVMGLDYYSELVTRERIDLRGQLTILGTNLCYVATGYVDSGDSITTAYDNLDTCFFAFVRTSKG